jgi:hypothetical protein
MIGIVILSAISLAGIVFLVRFFVAINDKPQEEQTGYVLYVPRKGTDTRRPIQLMVRWSDETGHTLPLLTDRGKAAPRRFQSAGKR